ncbi:MAG: S26 family signal peptidase [Coprobacillus cateniformis]
MKLKKRYLYSIIEMIVVIVVTICVFKFVVIPVRIDGTSMENTLHDQSIALINGIGDQGRKYSAF